MKRSLAQNAFFKSMLNICNIIIPIIIGPYTLRILNREYYDMFNGLNATFQFFLSFGALGIYNYGVREISRFRDNVDECRRFFTEVFILGCLSNALALVAFIGFAVFTTDSKLEIILSWILTIQFLGNVFNVEWINEANENYLFITIKSVIVKILYLVCTFLFVRQADDIIWYSVLLIFSTVVNTLVSFIYIKRKYQFSFRNIQLQRHLVPLIKIFVIANIMLLYAQLDKFMLKMFVSDAGVTAYQISQYISSMLYTLFVSIVIVAVPRFSNMLANNKKKECFTLHQNLSDSFFMFMIPITMGVIMLSGEVIILYGGEQYADCMVPLALYAVVQLVSSVHYILGEAFIYISGNENRLLVINVIGAAVNGVFNLLLVVLGLFTVEMAIITLILAYLIVGLMDYLFSSKKLGYNFALINRHTALYTIGALLFVPIILVVRLLPLGIFLRTVISFVICVGTYAMLLWVRKDEHFVEYFSGIIGFINRMKRV